MPPPRIIPDVANYGKKASNWDCIDYWSGLYSSQLRSIAVARIAGLGDVMRKDTTQMPAGITDAVVNKGFC